MDTVIAVATVRKPYNGYVLQSDKRPIPANTTRAEADELFREWAHVLQDSYAPHVVEVRIHLWGKDEYWEY